MVLNLFVQQILVKISLKEIWKITTQIAIGF